MKKYITYLANELSEASINVIQYLIVAFALIVCVSLFILALFIVPHSFQDIVASVIKYRAITILVIALIILVIAILSTIFDFVKTSITYFKGAKND
ncbi:hypothetical protein [Lactococcus lactis]|uniref:Uncharacterized protein n=1 Tax=Lactococcus lactis subsp. hordniae TaxID=203404 RepID=A0A5M9Q023_LACLH|nr:hypothetical protein [Lactococcus lactis]KAA8701439.1 hypothetical protein F4V48_08805 [Lactococcus lactis subsp. hordniae]MCT3135762.1 hypothetical protein [Lactococcus lactis]